jgi:hypothetical protein
MRFLFLFLLMIGQGWGATYYVDATNGLNTNNGLTPETAWQTLTKASAAASGSTVLFKRGETFTGRLLPANSNMTYDVYGDLSLPNPIFTNTNPTGPLHTNGQSNLTINRIHFQGWYVLASSGGTGIVYNYCDFDIAAEATQFQSDGATVVINNSLFRNSYRAAVEVYGTNPNVSLNNCLFIGNLQSDGNHAALVEGAGVGKTVTLANSIRIGSGPYPQSFGTITNVTDGGGNQIAVIPQIKAYAYPNIFCLTFDGTDIDFMTEVAQYANSRGVPITIFGEVGQMSADYITKAQALHTAGNGVELHGFSHAPMDATQAISIATTNANPTVQVDAAAKQLILSTTTAGNSVTVDWSVTRKQISDLKTAVSGKGWTITNNLTGGTITDRLKLTSLADTAGAQSVPITLNLDLAPTYRFYVDEITDAATEFASLLGFTTTVYSWPYGNNNDTVIAWMQANSTMLGARAIDPVPSSLQLASLPIYKTSAATVAARIKGDGSEATIRANARNMCVYARMTGLLYSTYSHTASDFSAQQYEWLIDELLSCGVTFMTYGDAIAAIRADHATADNLTFTKTYTDASNFHIQGNSPARNAGVDVGLTTDIEGKPIRGLPDIGAYEFQPKQGNSLLGIQ